MCGKFTALASWSEVVEFSQPLTRGGGGDGDGGGDGSNDAIVTFRVGGPLPVIWDAEAGKRRVVKTRWGFPDPKDWRRPRPIHARAEAVEANELIRRTVKVQEDDPRMPAILEDDAWSTWLGEGGATPEAAKTVLKTMEGVNWQAAPEPKAPRPRKR